jgi:hypothetical protein
VVFDTNLPRESGWVPAYRLDRCSWPRVVQCAGRYPNGKRRYLVREGDTDWTYDGMVVRERATGEDTLFVREVPHPRASLFLTEEAGACLKGVKMGEAAVRQPPADTPAG